MVTGARARVVKNEVNENRIMKNEVIEHNKKRGFSSEYLIRHFETAQKGQLKWTGQNKKNEV